MTDWVVSNKIKPLADGALEGVPAWLREIAADPKISKLFGRLAGDWRAEVEKTAKASRPAKS